MSACVRVGLGFGDTLPGDVTESQSVQDFGDRWDQTKKNKQNVDLFFFIKKG